MYLEWVKKHFWVVLAFQLLLLLIITIIIHGGGFEELLRHVVILFLCTLIFSIIVFFLSWILRDSVSTKIVLIVLSFDISIIFFSILSLFGYYDKLIAIGVWGLLPFRTWWVFWSIKFNIKGTVKEPY
jgi:hypothetical protein